MTAIHVETLRDGYRDVCHWVRNGDLTSPRGRSTRERIDAELVVHDPVHDALPVGIGREVNPAIGHAEAAQLVGGVSDPELMFAIAPTFRNFADGSAFAGAYGPRTRWQLPAVVDRLVQDPDSRQAVVAIWDPAYDLYGAARDVPCTVALQFLLRRDELHLITTMRSNDVWLGLAYDVFQYTQLQFVVADVLGVGIGRYHHRAGSLHLYEDDWDRVDRLRLPDERTNAMSHLLVTPNDGRPPDERLARVQDGARNVLRGDTALAHGYDVLDPHLRKLGRS